MRANADRPTSPLACEFWKPRDVMVEAALAAETTFWKTRRIALPVLDADENDDERPHLDGVLPALPIRRETGTFSPSTAAAAACSSPPEPSETLGKSKIITLTSSAVASSAVRLD